MSVTYVCCTLHRLNVLKELPNIDNGIGLPDWRLTLCLLFSWVVLFLTLVKGVQSSGKVAYFTGETRAKRKIATR